MKTTKEDIKKYANTLAIAAAVGGGIYIAVKIYKTQKAKADLAKTKKDLDILKKQGVEPSFLSTQYTVFGNKLKQALYGINTDEDAVYGVFNSLKNTADVLELIKAFGIFIYPCNAIEFPISFALGKKDCGSGDLAMLMTNKLDTSEIKKINDILKAKGINYKF